MNNIDVDPIRISLRDTFAQMIHKKLNENNEEENSDITTNIYAKDLYFHEQIFIEIQEEDDEILENIKLMISILEEE